MRFERREHRSFALVIATPWCLRPLRAGAGRPAHRYRRCPGACEGLLAHSRRGLRLAAFGDRDLNPRKPAHFNRPCRSGRFPRAALEHRRRGSVSIRSDCRRRRQFAPFRRPLPPLQVPLLLRRRRSSRHRPAAGAGLWLRLRFSVDEVVATLLLNFVAVLFVSMLIDGPLKDQMGFGWPQSQPVADAAVLPKLFLRSRLHVGLMIALVLAVAVHLVQSRTVFGMQSRAAGLNPAGAVFAGRAARPHPGDGGLHFRRAGRTCGGYRSHGRAGLCDDGPVAGLRLFRHCRRHARQSSSAGRGACRPVHGRHVRRGRRDEPQHGYSLVSSPMSQSPCR